MKVLSIGNSFSQDAHGWLHALAEQNGVDMYTANLYIGGCSLETHWKNAEENHAYYDLEINGGIGERKISIAEALQMDEWDVVTLQQVSGFSGLYGTYEPYLSSLAALVKTARPAARLYFHQTWAYEWGAEHSDYPRYDTDQVKMYACIVKATEQAARAIEAGLIPAGKVIQTLRETVSAFDYRNGGLSLCRDGFHLSMDYGRLAVAAAWLRTLTGKQVEKADFAGFDDLLVREILSVVNGL